MRGAIAGALCACILAVPAGAQEEEFSENSQQVAACLMENMTDDVEQGFRGMMAAVFTDAPGKRRPKRRMFTVMPS